MPQTADSPPPSRKTPARQHSETSAQPAAKSTSEASSETGTSGDDATPASEIVSPASSLTAVATNVDPSSSPAANEVVWEGAIPQRLAVEPARVGGARGDARFDAVVPVDSDQRARDVERTVVDADSDASLHQ